MTKRRNLDREGLEVYLLYVLLAYRPLFLLAGLLLFVYGIAIFMASSVIGGIAVDLAILIILPAFSYPVCLALARLGAWLGTLRMKP